MSDDQTTGRNLLISILMNAVITVSEIVGGLVGVPCPACGRLSQRGDGPGGRVGVLDHATRQAGAQ